MERKERLKQQKRAARAKYRAKNSSAINAQKREVRRFKQTWSNSQSSNSVQRNENSQELPRLPSEVVNHIMEFTDESGSKKLEKKQQKAVHDKSYRKKHSVAIAERKKLKRAIDIDGAREATARHMRNHRKRLREEAEEFCEDTIECRIDRNQQGCRRETNLLTSSSHEVPPTIDANTPETFLSDTVNDEELRNRVTAMREELKAEEDVDENGVRCYRSMICVVCDRIILSKKDLEFITKETLSASGEKLGVGTYMEHFGADSLCDALSSQYRVEDPDLHDLLLSPRAKYCRNSGGYQCCVSCHTSLKSKVTNCPKYSIANGFAIGHIPSVLRFRDREDNTLSVPFNSEKDLTDLLCAAISPVRPFGYIHAYSGGSQKQIKGHFSLFSVDQSHVGGVLNKFRDEGGAKNIYVVLCGRMTPAQKALIKRRAVLDTSQFLNLLTWFIKSSGHKGYRDLTPPDECPDPIAYIEDEETENNTDTSENPFVEETMGNNTYYFSSGSQNPQPNMSVYNKSEDFIHEMLDNAGDPTMLMYGGSYLKSHEIRLEDAFPVQFPFGVGGPNMGVDRRVKVSTESCLKHYMRLSLNQFMRADFILVCYQMLCRSASFTTGLIKCRSNYQGTCVGEKLSKLSIEDMKLASTRLTSLQGSNQPISATSEAESFLTSVTSSCKSIGHTAEAAKEARKKCYALGDRFGPHSIFFTVTPDDECSFNVRMYANNGKHIYVPQPDCSESECVADFNVRAKTRLKYPGACSIYYQAAIQKVFELLGWDVRNKRATKSGMFGDIEAFCKADEEQGRGTLHGHFLIWLKNFNALWRGLFAEREEDRDRARAVLRNYIDKVFCADYNFDPTLPVVHEECCEQCDPDTINNTFEERDLQTFRDSRSKTLSSSVSGKVMQCKNCLALSKDKTTEGAFVSTDDVSKCFLRARMKSLSSHGTDESNEAFSDLDSFLSPERRDLLTSRYAIDDHDSSEEHGFLYDRDVRRHITTKRMNEHDWRHRPSCFKYGGECRYCFSFTCQECTNIKVDELDDDLGTTWRYVDGTSTKVYPFSARPKRGMGSQYLNTHCPYVTDILACNSNIQIGSPRCVFYVVHYTTKNTQKEDRGPDFERISHQVMARIQREKEKREAECRESESNEDLVDDPSASEDTARSESFREGLCRFLMGMSIHLSQDVVSATMAHLLVSQKGTRFTFSHDFKDLLLGQMLNRLNGQDPGDFVLRRRMKSETEADMWPDFSVNDYLYRDKSLENVSYYEFTAVYEKSILSSQRMQKLQPDGFPELKTGEMRFEVGHPGRRYCVLKKSSCDRVPKISSPHGMLCNIEDLELLQVDRDESNRVSDAALYKRENYAKAALVLFHPFRNSDVFSLGDDRSFGCLWDKFQSLMQSGQLLFFRQ